MMLVVSVMLLTWWTAPRGERGQTHGDARAVARTPSSWVDDPRRRALICGAGCGVVAAAVAGVPLAPVGVAGGLVVSWWLGRLEPASVARRRRRIAADLPLTADLLAACARVGEPLVSSVAVVVEAVGGPVGDALSQLDARVRLGGDPETEWRRLLTDEQLAPLARTIVRCVSSGAPVADGLDRLAADRRRELRTEAQVRARSVGVRSAGPLAACFLPAFVAIGIVPTVVAGFGRIVLGQ